MGKPFGGRDGRGSKSRIRGGFEHAEGLKMDDLVKWLRRQADVFYCAKSRKAADEITRLTALVAEQQRQIEDCLAKLTPKERLILSMIAKGASKRAMAAEINASVRTVELHHARLRKKLGADSTTQLVRFAVWADDGDDSLQAEGSDHDFRSGHGAEGRSMNR